MRSAYHRRRARFLRAVVKASRALDLPYETGLSLVLRTFALLTDDVIDGKIVTVPGFGTFGAMASKVRCRNGGYMPIYATCGFNPSRHFVAACAATLDPRQVNEGVGRVMLNIRRGRGLARKRRGVPMNVGLPYPRDYIEDTVLPSLAGQSIPEPELVDDSPA